MKWKTKLIDAVEVSKKSLFIEGMVFYNPYRGLYGQGTGKTPMVSEDNYVEVMIGNDIGGNVSMKQWWGIPEIKVVRQQPLEKKRKS